MHIWSVWHEVLENPVEGENMGDMTFESNEAVIAFFERMYPKCQIEDFDDEIHVYAADADFDDDDVEPIAGAQYEGRVSD